MGSDFRRFINIRWAWALVAAMFLYGIGVGVLAPMNAVYMQAGIGLTKAQITWVFCCSLLLNMLLTVAAGLFSDRLRRRKSIPLSAAALCACGLLIYMRADGFSSALIGMTLASAPSGMIMGQLFAMARNHFTRWAPDIVEISQLWLRATFSVGFFTGLLVGANVYLLASFRGVLWGNLFGYAALFALLLLYRETETEPGTKRTAEGEPFSLAMLLALLLLSCADAIRGLYLPLVVSGKFGDPRYASYLWSAQAVFELLFMMAAGYWAAKYGSKRLILYAAIGAFATYVVYARTDSLAVYFTMQPVYSFFVSVLLGVAMGYVQRMFIHRAGFGASLYVFISQTASLAGYMLPLVVPGISADVFYIPAGLVLISVAILCVVLLKERAVGYNKG